MDRIIEQLPRFFSGPNMLLLLEAAGLTLGMTVIGCVIGFGLAFVLVVMYAPGGISSLFMMNLSVVMFKKFSRLVLPYLAVIAAGVACGMGLAGMIAVALALIASCTQNLPF